MMENSPGNPHAAELSRVMICNLLAREGLSDEKDETAAAVALLQQRQADAPAAPDIAAVTAYVTGDESEILLSAAQAAALGRLLEHLNPMTTEHIGQELPAIVGDSDEYDALDVKALARSLSLLIKERTRRSTANLLIDTLTERYPGLAKAPRTSLNYAVAPLLWETIPVPASETRHIARITPIENAELTGSAYMVEGIRRSIFSSQITSIGLALLAVFLLNWFSFRSLKRGLVSLTAITVTIFINFGMMGLLGVPLDFTTALIASVAIGTGIDYTIHFITRFSREVEEHGGDIRSAYAVTLSTTGKAIVFNAVSVGAGFAVLCLSNIIPFRTAGALLAVTMLTSSLGAMTLLPAVLVVSGILKKKKKTPAPAHGSGKRT